MPSLLQPLIPSVTAGTVTCAQAVGSEIYIGCSNGELLRYVLHQDADPAKLAAYALVSQQTIPLRKQIDELILVPSIARALILCDRQVHIYSIPSLDLVPNIKPIRHVETLAIDHTHLQRPAAPSLALGSSSTSLERAKADAVDLCVIKRTTLAMYSLSEEKLVYIKEISLRPGILLARRSGRHMCIATREVYCMVDLADAQMMEVLPLSQVPDSAVTIKPHILVVSKSEFLILSWTGSSTLGVFLNGGGDPVRGTLGWDAYPKSLCLDYPNIISLLPNGTIEVHDAETQAKIQDIAVPDPRDGAGLSLVSCLAGYAVPSLERAGRMSKVKVGLVRGGKAVESERDVENEEDVPSVSI